MIYIAFALGALLPLAVSPVLAEEIPALIKALRDRKPEIRAQAAEALVKAGPKAVRPLLEWAFNDTTKSRAERMISQMGPKAIPSVMALLDEPALRIKAGGILTRVIARDSQDRVPALIACVREKPEVKHYCGQALVSVCEGGFGRSALLVKALTDSDKDLRLYAAAALGRAGAGGEGVAALAKALKDPEPGVRAAAAGALGMLGAKAKAAIPSLQQLSREGTPELRRAAEEALKSIHG